MTDLPTLFYAPMRFCLARPYLALVPALAFALGFRALRDRRGAWLLLSAAALPLALPITRTVGTRTDGPSLNAALAETGRLLAVFSLLLAAGVLLS